MQRHMTMPLCDKSIAMQMYPHLASEQASPTNIPAAHGSLFRHASYNPMHPVEASAMFHRHAPMPSYEPFTEDEQPLRVHVGNIPFLWTIDDLRKQFLVFGPVKDPEIVSNERGSKGFGFITFLRHSDGMNAIRVKNGSIADGRKITVALASSRSSLRINTHRCCCYPPMP